MEKFLRVSPVKKTVSSTGNEVGIANTPLSSDTKETPLAACTLIMPSIKKNRTRLKYNNVFFTILGTDKEKLRVIMVVNERPPTTPLCQKCWSESNEFLGPPRHKYVCSTLL